MAKKKMTAREKAMRAQIKKELQANGILPPDKPRLNRKKYTDEAVEAWDNRDADYLLWDYMLNQAVGLMCGHGDRRHRISEQAIGAAKCLKIAIRLKEFHCKVKAEGRTNYTIGEQYNYIKDILEE